MHELIIINHIDEITKNVFVIRHLQHVIFYGTHVSHMMPKVIIDISVAFHVASIESEMEYALIGSV